MAIRRGRGVAAINYPTGMNLGGDPTQALVHSTPTGNFMVTLSSVDLGQGLKQFRTAWAPSPRAAPTAPAMPSSRRPRKPAR
jgi:CO/xanthine dehydrogenase Mo-binding subunit